MKYDTDKTYAIGYYCPRRDDYIQVHTDSLATAINSFLVRSKRYPNRRIDLFYTHTDKCLAVYEDGEFVWQLVLKEPEWQKWIEYKIAKLQEIRARKKETA